MYLDIVNAHDGKLMAGPCHEKTSKNHSMILMLGNDFSGNVFLRLLYMIFGVRYTLYQPLC